MWDFQRSPKKTPPSPSTPPTPPFILLSPSHLPPQLDVRAATTARRRPDRWGDDTKQSVSVCGDLKETLIPAERGGSAQRAAEWERDGFNDAENWPVTVVHPSGKSLLQLAVNLSVPLSSHPAPPTPQRRLAQNTPPPLPSHPPLTLTQLLLRPPIQNFHLPAMLALSP